MTLLNTTQEKQLVKNGPFTMEGKKVLVFDARKKLISIHSSLRATSIELDIKPSNISATCTGRGISCKVFYFRYLSDKIELEVSDLGRLRLEEYDSLCGEKRKVYKNTSFSRKGMKYRKSSSKKDNDSDTE